MTTSRSKFLLILCVAFLPAVAVLRAGQENRQPHMENALHFLQDAKKSEHPVELLRSAKKELEKASHNKGGFRPVAIEIVEKAIAESEAGNTQKMVEKIDSAIANIHTGMYKAP